MTLSDVQVGHIVQIVRVGGAGSYRRRLMELGLIPGTRVELLRIAPLGDPLELLVRGASLSIRKSEAAIVEVQNCGKTAPSLEKTKAVGLEPRLGV